jgi:hypothetical protein
VKRLTTVVGALAAAGAAITIGIGPASADTNPVKPYTVPVGSEYEIRPLLSAGDTVPETGNPGKEYRMVGIPDGLGASLQGGAATLHMNHELTQATTSEPEVGRPANRGALVSKYSLDKRGAVSGERAYDTVFQENTAVGPAATTANATPGFARFCSGNFAGRDYGFDRGIYLTGEETDGASTFDGKGGQTVAMFDNEAHALPKLGHFAKENSLPQPRTDQKTVIMTLEDGPSGPDSQLYMYVGTKQPAGGALTRNGLDNGKLFTFVSDDPTKNSETTFTTGNLTGHWVEVPGADALTDAQLETASVGVGAMGFVRIEDGAWSKRSRNDFFFVTTGGNKAAGNELGRLYHVRLGADPTGPATLEIVYNADMVIANGGDTAISPDNVDTSGDQLMINEDGTSQSRAVMGAKGRDGSIWRFDLVPSGNGQTADGASATRVAQLNPPGRDGVPVGPGVWETSGIINLGGVFGGNFWLFDVQAHPPTTAPAPGTVEDGQLLLMRRVRGNEDG